MKTVKLLSILVLAITLAVVVIQNTSPVQVRFLWLSGEMPAILLLFLTSAGGFILGLVVALAIRSGPPAKVDVSQKRD